MHRSPTIFTEGGSLPSDVVDCHDASLLEGLNVMAMSPVNDAKGNEVSAIVSCVHVMPASDIHSSLELPVTTVSPPIVSSLTTAPVPEDVATWNV
jgi:hypothetical protein